MHQLRKDIRYMNFSPKIHLKCSIVHLVFLGHSGLSLGTVELLDVSYCLNAMLTQYLWGSWI